MNGKFILAKLQRASALGISCKVIPEESLRKTLFGEGAGLFEDLMDMMQLPADQVDFIRTTLSFVYYKAFDESPASLPGLFPLFAALCGEKKGTPDNVPSWLALIDWTPVA